MSHELFFVLQLVVAIVLLQSFVGKIVRPIAFLRGVTEYRVLPRSFAYTGGVVVIAVEGLGAMAHFTGLMLGVIAPLLLCLFVLFGWVAVVILKRGDKTPCLCFGSRGDEDVSRLTLIRLAMLALAESIILLGVSSGSYQPLAGKKTVFEYVFAAGNAVIGLLIVVWLIHIPAIFEPSRDEAA